MVNTEMKNAFNAFNAPEPMNWVQSNTKQNEAKKAQTKRKRNTNNTGNATTKKKVLTNTKQNEAKKAHNEALKAAVKRSQAQANAEKAARRKKEEENRKKKQNEAKKAHNEALKAAVKRSQAQANAEKAARRKKEEANKARNERARVRAQKKEEENRKKKQNEAAKKKAEEENRKKKTNAERRASNASTNKNKSFWKTVLNKIKNSNMTEEQKLKEGKKVYKKAAFKLHPNKGGKKEDFQEFSNFYNKFKENPYPEIKPRKQPRNFGGYPF